MKFEDIVRLRLLLKTDGLGPSKILRLYKVFGNFENIFLSSTNELANVNLINTALATRIIEQVPRYNIEYKQLEGELDFITSHGGKLLTFWDEYYPTLLKNIYYPPLLLYVLGEINLLNSNCIAVVGTRSATSYGKRNAEKFSSDLVRDGFVIVSGLARGIDSIAHSAALESGGKTIAVIGSGLDVIYPPENRSLFEKIVASGAVISEFPLGTKPDAPNFPKRNRIISGLSLGTLVIETKTNGGAIQTAAHALNQNREVFAIPGNISIQQSEGTNLLIQRGEAKLTTCVEDITSEFSIDETNINPVHADLTQLSFFEQQIIDKLSQEPKHIDVLASELSISTSELLVQLLQMEFSGYVKQQPGMVFVRKI